MNLRIYRDVFAINIKIQEKNMMFAIDSILYTIILCAANVVLLAFLKLGVAGYFYAYILANTASILFLIIFGKVISIVKGGKFDPALVKRLIVFSMPLIINGISWWITNASDRFMIDWLMGEPSVGIYS